ncbi:MAG: short-chain dehydrogenase/reductase [Rhodoglobus sp.]|nr:short-chain dehydrogenase/reductase [Rhodoglobus sp.]
MKLSAIVSGAGIGIGAAVAHRLAADGFHVVVTDILCDEGCAVRDQIIAAGGSAEFLELDVRDSEQVNHVFSAVQSGKFPLDVVVANAGVAYKQTFLGVSDAEWNHVVDIDLNGAMRMFREGAAQLQERGAGTMIAMTSIMGNNYGWSEHASYSAAKAGLIGLVRALAVEFGPAGVRVNGVAPGYIRTAQSLSEVHSLGEAGLDASRHYIPLRRIGEPEDIADVVAFLASRDSRYISGQIITVDGGLQVGRN